jgi:hypothetical protein
MINLNLKEVFFKRIKMFQEEEMKGIQIGEKKKSNYPYLQMT